MPSTESDVARRVITVMKIAVPAAPATCWIVLIIALPCEYSCGGSAPSPVVNSGVNISARPTLRIM